MADIPLVADGLRRWWRQSHDTRVRLVKDALAAGGRLRKLFERLEQVLSRIEAAQLYSSKVEPQQFIRQGLGVLARTG